MAENSFETVRSLPLEQEVQSAAESLRKCESVGDLFDAAQETALAYMDAALNPHMIPIEGITKRLHSFLDTTNSAHVTREQLDRVLKQQDFQGVDTDSDAYFTLLQAAALRDELVRKLVRATVSGEHPPAYLSPVAKIYLEQGTRIQDVVDRFSLKWQKEVAQGKAFGELKRLQQEYDKTHPDTKDSNYTLFKQFLAPQLPGHGDFLYVMPRIAEDATPQEPKFTAVPYAEAFPEEISEMAHLMDEMIAQLQPYADQENVDARGLIQIHTALRDLLTCTGDAAEQEKRGKALDRAFVNATNAPGATMTVLPPMEAYKDPWKMLVEMEYTIAFKDERHKTEDKEAQEALDSLVAYFQQEDSPFAKHSVVQESLPKMKNARSNFYAMLRSGSSYEAMASNIPNRIEIRFNTGTVINMSYASFVRKMEMSEKLIQSAFGAPLKDPATTIEHQSIHVALHERGHSLMVAPDTISRLTSPIYAEIEEAKADMIGLVGGLHYLRNLPKDNVARRKEFMLAELCQNLRGLTRWQDRDDRTHFHGNTLILDLMIQTGILKQAEQGRWVFEPTEENMDTLFQKAEGVLEQFAKVYQSRDPQMAEKLMHDLFSEETVLPLAQAASIDTSQPLAAAA